MPDKRIDGRKPVKKGQKLWDSLAVAGLNASRRNASRLVILMIGQKLEDSSHLSVRQAVDYLASIHVPLLVWAPTRQDLVHFGLDGHDPVFVGLAGMTTLEETVYRTLASQTIIWVKGDYLPTELELSPRVPAAVDFVR